MKNVLRMILAVVAISALVYAASVSLGYHGAPVQTLVVAGEGGI